MPAIQYNILLEEGSNFNLDFTWYDVDGYAVDLTAYSATMHIKKNKEDLIPIVKWDNSSEITLGGAAGTISISVDADVIRNLALSTGWKGYYQLEVYISSPNTTRLLEGRVRWSREVVK